MPQQPAASRPGAVPHVFLPAATARSGGQGGAQGPAGAPLQHTALRKTPGAGCDHGHGRRPPARGSRAPGVELAPGPRRSAVRCTPRRRHTRSGSRFAAALSPREHLASAYPAPPTGSFPSSPPPAPAAAALPAQAARRRRLALLGAAGRYLNWGITLSEISRMVFITTSRGTDAVQLTSNIISSELKFSRRKWILSTTSSGVPNRLASTAVSGLADPASVLPMPALPA